MGAMITLFVSPTSHEWKLLSLLVTARKWSLGQGNIFTPVCHSVHGGSASVHAGIPPPRADTPPPEQTPPWGQTPWEQTPQEQAPPPGAGTPPQLSMLGDTVNKRAVHILLECNLVWICKWEITCNMRGNLMTLLKSQSLLFKKKCVSCKKNYLFKFHRYEVQNRECLTAVEIPFGWTSRDTTMGLTRLWYSTSTSSIIVYGVVQSTTEMVL